MLMREVAYLTVADVDSAIAALGAHENAMLLAGGTNVVDYLRAGVISPSVLIDISAVPLAGVHAGEAGFTIGGLARMSDVAADPGMRAFFPVVTGALELSASAQLRNMATMGGNLMQRTRCGYFREPGFACNKRAPGSGCAARDGLNRPHAVLGGSGQCVATHASDLAVALVALDATVRLQGPAGTRQLALTGFYRMPGDTPQLENELQPGEMIVQITAAGVPGAAGSHYLKVRERASYEFAVVSVAAVVHAPGGVIETARIAFGGVGTVPWRDHAAERALTGVSVDDSRALRSAAGAALAGAEPLAHNGFKVEMGRRALVRAVQIAAGVR
jgi:xanthine dehydrogenase YagS FAD-binding subunit